MWFVLGVSRSVSPVSHYRHEGLSVTEVIAHESVTLPYVYNARFNDLIEGRGLGASVSQSFVDYK